MSECKCKKPVLQKNTRQCGHCKFYINRVKHILMIAERILKIYPKFVIPGSLILSSFF